MSIGSAIHNASTGLRASARLAETVANNVANAMTPGYLHRSTVLTSTVHGGYGGGVRIVGTVRAELPALTAERRLLAASAGAASTLGAAHGRILAAIGEPGMPTALATRATAFETALIGAAAAPSSSVKLGQALDGARDLIAGLHAAAAEAAAVRTEAEAEIVRQVERVNRALAEVEALNAKIVAAAQQGMETASLEDERGRAIDAIAEIVPVRTVKRDGGAVAIFTAGGGMLLDGRAWPLRFERTSAVIGPDSPAVLNGLEQDRGNGQWGPVAVNGVPGFMDGGSLAALFEVRDTVALQALRELDRYAADLLDRFTAPPFPAAALDANGDGLFVDPGAGGPGLAARLALNPAVDAAQGGAAFRLRDGLGAAVPGPEGFGTFLQAMADAMTAPRNPGGMLSTGAQSGAAGLAAEMGAFFGALAARADDSRAFVTAQHAIIAEREIGATGVDSDTELQLLMLVEQAYAANAKVLTVIDSLLKQLLEI